jgi:hypothetical protein
MTRPSPSYWSRDHRVFVTVILELVWPLRAAGRMKLGLQESGQ